MHPTKHPPLPARGPYHSPNQLNYFSSLNTLALTQTDHHEELADDATDLTHSPIPTYTISDPAALMSRMTTTADPDRDPSASSPASSMASSRGRAKGKTKMLDKFGSLGKKVVKEVLGGTGNNYRFPPSNANLSTFGRGGAARPKVRVYGATPMPLPANQTLSLISTDAANPYYANRRPSVDAVSQPWNGGLAVQVDTVITSSGSATSASTSALGEDRLLLPGATRGLGSSTSSRDPSSASVAGPLPLPFSGPEPPRQPRLAVAPKPKVGAEQGDMSSVLKPDSDGPRTVRGGMDNLVLCSNNNEGRAGPLHGSINVQREEAKRILDDSFSSSSSSFPPSSSASASAPPLVPPRSFHATTTTAATSTFSQNQPQNLEGTMSTPTRSRRTPSGSVSPLPQPALPLNTKPTPQPTTNTTAGHPYAFLSSPPQPSSTSKLDRRASTMTTTTTISHPRTTASAKSLARRPPPLQLHPDQVFYPRAQLPEQKAYGSGLLEEEEGDGRGTSPAGVVSEWWDDEEDNAALQSPGVVRRGVTPAGSCVVEVGSRATTVVPGSAGRDGRGVVRVDDTYEMDGDGDGDGLLSLVEFVDEDARARVGRKDEHQHQQRRQHQPPVVGLHQEGGETKQTRRPLPTLPPQVPQQPGHSRQVSYAQASSLQPQHHHLGSSSTSNSHGSTQSRTTTSDTHSHSHSLTQLPPQPDPSSSSIPPNPTANTNANALLIQNALAMLTAAAPPATTAGGLPTSPLLNFGLPFQPQAQPQLAYGPLSPLLGATLGQHPQQQQQQPALSLGGTAGLELLVALANQNLRLMAAVEQQRLDLQQQQQQRRQEDVVSEAEGLGLDTRPQDVAVPDADASSALSPSPAPAPRQVRTSTSRSPARSSTSTPSSTNQPSSSSSSSSSKRASLAQSQQTPTPPVSPRGRIGSGTGAHGTRSSSIASSSSSSTSTASTSGFAKRVAAANRPTPPPLKARISTPKLGRPFRISLSTVLGRDEDEETAAASSSSRPNPPPPVPPLPASVRGQPEPHARLSDYEADDDHEDDEGEDTEAEDRPKSWMAAEVKGLEQLVLGGGDTTEIETETEADVETETETETAAESTARATAMGGLKSPGLFSVSTGTTAVDTLRSSRKSGFEYDSERAASPKKGDAFGAKPAPPSQTPVPFPKSPARSREMSGFASAAYAMRPGGGSGTGRTLSTLSRLAPPGWERPRESFDSLDSFDSFASTVSSNGGAMDLEELSIMTAHVFS